MRASRHSTPARLVYEVGALSHQSLSLNPMHHINRYRFDYTVNTA